MSQTYALDRVIQQVARDIRPEGPSQQVLVIDTRTGQEAKTRLPFRDYRYYLLSNDSDPQNVAQVHIPAWQLTDLDYKASVSLLLQVRCPVGSERKVALALFDRGHSPSDKLEEHLNRWLAAKSRDEVAAFIRRCSEERAVIEREMAADVRRDTGLAVVVKLSLDAERSLGPIRIDREHLLVVPKDFNEEQDVSLKAELEVNRDLRANAILNHPRSGDLQQIVPAEIQRFIGQQVSMQTFCTELTSASIMDALKAHLDKTLERFGRRVSRLVIKPKVPTDLLFFLEEEEVAISVPIQKLPEPVVIKNKVLMVLKDVARFRAKAPEPRQWLRDTLTRVIHERLFDASYIDLLIGFQDPGGPEADIKRALSEHAHAIGYEVRHLLTAPALPPLSLKDNFTIEARGTFLTKVTNVQVKLDIIVTARIRDLKKIEGLLNRRQNVRSLMEEAIGKAVQGYLHKIDPERFYMRFTYSDVNDEQAVEAELDSVIRQRLQGDEFHAEVIDLVIKQVGTDLSERLRTLRLGTGQLKLEAEPLQGGGRIPFKGDLRVHGVDIHGWDRFECSVLTLDEICARVQEHLLAHLETRSGSELAYKGGDERSKMEQEISDLVCAYVREQFGLSVKVSNIRRTRTELEDAVSDHLDARVIARLGIEKSAIDAAVDAQIALDAGHVGQIEQLIERRNKLLEADGTSSEIDEVDIKIRALKSELSNKALPSMVQLEQALLGPSQQRPHFSGPIAPVPTDRIIEGSPG